MRAVALRLLLLLVPALVGAVDVPRVPDLNAGLNVPPGVKAPERLPGAPGLPSVDALRTALAGQIPPLPIMQVPQGERLAVSLAPAAMTATVAEHLLGKGALGAESLRGLEQAATKALAGQDPQGAGQVATRYFDGGAKSGNGNGDAPWSPAIPGGVVAVDVNIVRAGSDVDRYIPSGINSAQLIDELKRGIGQMAPYRVFTYRDSKGGAFTGIDLSEKPRLVEILPEQHSHEIKLIKKIQLYNTDLQVIVREEGKTPDLVMGGMVTELKSILTGDRIELPLDKANTQVFMHARRHGLGDGAVAIDMTSERRVPSRRALAQINAWAAKPETALITVHKNGEEIHKSPNALQRIYVFSQMDMKIFDRQKDGLYALSDSTRVPFVRGPPADQKIKQNVHVAQFLVKNGRGRAAQNLVTEARRIEKNAGKLRSPRSPVAQARERIEALQFLGRMKRLARRRRYSSMRALWENFAQTSPAGSVAEIRPAVLALFGDMAAQNVLAQELEVPRVALERRGVRAGVVVTGGARETPGSRWYREARKFAKLLAKGAGKSVAVVTNGADGIMQAANRGAQEAGGSSVAHAPSARSGDETRARWQTFGLTFHYQHAQAQKANMRHLAAAHVYFPGGFDTMDDLFEVVTLMRAGRLPRAPIVLVGGVNYWAETLDFKRFVQLGLLKSEDVDLFQIVDGADEAWAAVNQTLRK